MPNTGARKRKNLSALMTFSGHSQQRVQFFVLEIDMGEITRESLIEKKLKLLELKASIENQIEDDKALRVSNKQPIDHDWIRRAKFKLRMTSLGIQRVNESLSELNRKEKQANYEKNLDQSLRYERKFYFAAKRILDPDTFARIQLEIEE